MEFNSKICNAKVCPYCGEKPTFTDSKVVYGKSYGMIYLCTPCSAWVGVHVGSKRPLGRLANSHLRNLKKEAHKYFDALWKRKMMKGFKKGKARKLAYRWLSLKLGAPKKYTHIGMFDEELCNKVIDLCKPYYFKWIKYEMYG